MSKALVHLIDDDEAVRKSLSFLLKAADYSVETYDSAKTYLEQAASSRCDCIVTDVRMPEISGLQLIRKIRGSGSAVSIIVITGHGDVPIAVEAMKAGACDFLEKPFGNESLIRAIEGAVALQISSEGQDQERKEIGQRIESLTERERQVMRGVVSGASNKEVARNLGISPRTVDIYRANVMTKMRAESLPELVRLTITGGF